jgi:hypothetical protein
VKLVQTLLVALLAKATTELVLKARQLFELAAKRMQQEQPLKASQPAGPRQVSEKLPEQAKLARLETAPVVPQLDPPALVFALQGQRSSARSRA